MTSFDENPYSRDFFPPDFNSILYLATRSSKYYSIAEEFLQFSEFAYAIQDIPLASILQYVQSDTGLMKKIVVFNYWIIACRLMYVDF